MEQDLTHPEAPPHAAHGAHEPRGADAHHEEYHPDWSVYWKIALILGIITVGEVWMYYIPAVVASRAFVPTLLALSALKFGIVVMFYMHLKYDHRLFRALFTGPLLIAAATLIALMFLFGHFAAKL